MLIATSSQQSAANKPDVKPDVRPAAAKLSIAASAAADTTRRKSNESDIENAAMLICEESMTMDESAAGPIADDDDYVAEKESEECASESSIGLERNSANGGQNAPALSGVGSRYIFGKRPSPKREASPKTAAADPPSNSASNDNEPANDEADASVVYDPLTLSTYDDVRQTKPEMSMADLKVSDINWLCTLPASLAPRPSQQAAESLVSFINRTSESSDETVPLPNQGKLPSRRILHRNVVPHAATDAIVHCIDVDDSDDEERKGRVLASVFMRQQQSGKRHGRRQVTSAATRDASAKMSPTALPIVSDVKSTGPVATMVANCLRRDVALRTTLVTAPSDHTVDSSVPWLRKFYPVVDTDVSNGKSGDPKASDKSDERDKFDTSFDSVDGSHSADMESTMRQMSSDSIGSPKRKRRRRSESSLADLVPENPEAFSWYVPPSASLVGLIELGLQSQSSRADVVDRLIGMQLDKAILLSQAIAIRCGEHPNMSEVRTLAGRERCMADLVSANRMKRELRRIALQRRLDCQAADKDANRLLERWKAMLAGMFEDKRKLVDLERTLDIATNRYDSTRFCVSTRAARKREELGVSVRGPSVTASGDAEAQSDQPAGAAESDRFDAVDTTTGGAATSASGTSPYGEDAAAVWLTEGTYQAVPHAGGMRRNAAPIIPSLPSVVLGGTTSATGGATTGSCSNLASQVLPGATASSTDQRDAIGPDRPWLPSANSLVQARKRRPPSLAQLLRVEIDDTEILGDLKYMSESANSCAGSIATKRKRTATPAATTSGLCHSMTSLFDSYGSPHSASISPVASPATSTSSSGGGSSARSIFVSVEAGRIVIGEERADLIRNQSVVVDSQEHGLFSATISAFTQSEVTLRRNVSGSDSATHLQPQQQQRVRVPITHLRDGRASISRSGSARRM